MTKGYVKEFNEKSLPIYGVARCYDIQIGYKEERST